MNLKINEIIVFLDKNNLVNKDEFIKIVTLMTYNIVNKL